MQSVAFQHTAGAKLAHTIFVGEAWGAEEEQEKLPFVGQAGREFARMLAEAWEEPELLQAAEEKDRRNWLSQRESWLQDRGVLLTNVFALRPHNNNLAALCADRTELPAEYSPPAARTQSPRYIRPEYLEQLTRLRTEIETTKPNLVVALGATACWALLGRIDIGSIRGAITTAKLVDGQKLLPTYHPANVLYQWANRGTVIADLKKAYSEARHPDIIRPERSIAVDLTREQLEGYMKGILLQAKILAVDIETFKGQIRCVGFAWAKDQALVIPLFHASKDHFQRNHWQSEEDELYAWWCIRTLCESPVPKLFQNGLFDLQYLTRAGIHTANVAHDTMLLHHSMYPELPKGLGFLGSIYTNEQAWKLLRKHGEDLKRDE